MPTHDIDHRSGPTGGTRHAYDHVVVPLDLGFDADRALPVAAGLARRVGAGLAVVVVGSPHTVIERDEGEARWHAQRVGVQLDRVFLRCDDEDVAGGVLDAVRQARGVLCCSTHAYGRLGSLLFDGVSEGLLHRTTAPVVLVGPAVPAREHGFRSLVACVDGNRSMEVVTGAAARWARLLDVPVEVLHCVPPGRDQYRYLTAERAASRLGEQGLRATTRVVVHEHPETAILDSVGGYDEPLLVMASHDREHHGGPPLGPVTRSVVAHGPVPVLAVPRGPEPRGLLAVVAMVPLTTALSCTRVESGVDEGAEIAVDVLMCRRAGLGNA